MSFFDALAWVGLLGSLFVLGCGYHAYMKLYRRAAKCGKLHLMDKVKFNVTPPIVLTVSVLWLIFGEN